MSNMRQFCLSLLVYLPLLVSLATGQELSVVKPEDVGMSSERLQRVETFMQRAVEDNRMAGAVAMVARRGKVVYIKAVGMMDREAEKMKSLARLPLLHHPGEKYEYGLSVDVLGYLVEVVSGKTLDEFFRTRVFQPLGMQDTHFFPPKEKLKRLAAVYERSGEGELKKVSEEPIVQRSFVYRVDYPYHGPQRYYSGGGGLCSTMSDYMRFCQMLLNGGDLNGARLLSRKTVELMTTFLIDPKEQLIVICMTQLRPGHSLPINDVVPILATQAIAD